MTLTTLPSAMALELAIPPICQYWMANCVTKDFLRQYADKVGQGAHLNDLRYIDLWSAGNINQQEFLKATKMSGLTQWSDEQRVKYDDQGVQWKGGSGGRDQMRQKEFAPETACTKMLMICTRRHCKQWRNLYGSVMPMKTKRKHSGADAGHGWLMKPPGRWNAWR